MLLAPENQKKRFSGPVAWSGTCTFSVTGPFEVVVDSYRLETSATIKNPGGVALHGRCTNSPNTKNITWS